MSFLRKIFWNDKPSKNIDAISEKNPTISDDCQIEDSQDSLENSSQTDQFAPTFVNLRSKLLRNQKSASAPPEILHENEAWAPEVEFVGLFRKRRFNTMEQPSFSTDQK